MRKLLCDFCKGVIENDAPARDYTLGHVRIRLDGKEACLRCFHRQAQVAVDALAANAVRATVERSGRIKI